MNFVCFVSRIYGFYWEKSLNSRKIKKHSDIVSENTKKCFKNEDLAAIDSLKTVSKQKLRDYFNTYDFLAVLRVTSN